MNEILKIIFIKKNKNTSKNVLDGGLFGKSAHKMALKMSLKHCDEIFDKNAHKTLTSMNALGAGGSFL